MFTQKCCISLLQQCQMWWHFQIALQHCTIAHHAYPIAGLICSQIDRVDAQYPGCYSSMNQGCLAYVYGPFALKPNKKAKHKEAMHAYPCSCAAGGQEPLKLRLGGSQLRTGLLLEMHGSVQQSRLSLHAHCEQGNLSPQSLLFLLMGLNT